MQSQDRNCRVRAAERVISSRAKAVEIRMWRVPRPASRGRVTFPLVNLALRLLGFARRLCGSSLLLLCPFRTASPTNPASTAMNTLAGVRLGLWCWVYFCCLLAWVSPLFLSRFISARPLTRLVPVRSSRLPSLAAPKTTLVSMPPRQSSSSSPVSSETLFSRSGESGPLPAASDSLGLAPADPVRA